MAEVLNRVGVHAACVGNHDFDYGLESFLTVKDQSKFSWLLSNVLDKRTGQPLWACLPSLLLDWHGVSVGLLGLVEPEWLETLPCLEPDELIFTDFVERGRALAEELRETGAEIVIALTHMRLPNDRVLAAEVPEIDLVLGGHDHDYHCERTSPHGTLLAKSGTDFRELSAIRVTLSPPPAPAQQAQQQHAHLEQVPENDAEEYPSPTEPLSPIASVSHPEEGQWPGRVQHGSSSARSSPSEQSCTSPRLRGTCCLRRRSFMQSERERPSCSFIKRSFSEGGEVQGLVLTAAPAANSKTSQLLVKKRELIGGLVGKVKGLMLGKDAPDEHDQEQHPGQGRAAAYLAGEANKATAPEVARHEFCTDPTGGDISYAPSSGAEPEGGSPQPEVHADAVDCQRMGGGGNVMLQCHCRRVDVTSELPEDPETAAIAERYNSLLGAHMCEVAGSTAVDLDGRFASVRSRETNLGKPCVCNPK